MPDSRSRRSTRGIELGADVIAIDGGSTDSGPHYLGRRHRQDHRAAGRARPADGCSGRRQRRHPPHRRVVRHQRHRLRRRLGGRHRRARSWPRRGSTSRWRGSTASRTPADLKERLDAGRIHPLPPMGDLDAETLESCTPHRRDDGPRADRLGARGRRQGRPRGPGHRHGARSGVPADEGHAGRAHLARREDRRVRRPVHHQPAHRWCLRHHRRHRLHHRAARSGHRVHAHLRGRAHALRDRQPVPAA